VVAKTGLDKEDVQEIYQNLFQGYEDRAPKVEYGVDWEYISETSTIGFPMERGIDSESFVRGTLRHMFRLARQNLLDGVLEDGFLDTFDWM
jgi:hypothetical protein